MIEILKKYNIENIPGNYTDYGFIVVYWDGCFFLKENKCSIYDDRPVLCRQFPVIIGNDGKLCVTTECKFYKEIDFKDISDARRLQAKERGKFIKETNSFKLKNSEKDFKLMAASFLSDQKKFENKIRKGDESCYWINAEKFLEVQKKAIAKN